MRTPIYTARKPGIHEGAERAARQRRHMASLEVGNVTAPLAAAAPLLREQQQGQCRRRQARRHAAPAARARRSAAQGARCAVFNGAFTGQESALWQVTPRRAERRQQAFSAAACYEGGVMKTAARMAAARRI